MNRMTPYGSPIDRMFEQAVGDVLRPLMQANAQTAQAATFALDVHETPEAYLVAAELPGVPKDRIDVQVEDADVTIRAESREEKATNAKPLRQERAFGTMTRSIRLPQPVDTSNAEAKHVDGVLWLTLPKKQASAGKRLAIS